MKYNIIIVCLLFLCGSCGQIDTQRQGEDLKKEMKAKRLKRLTDGQIQAAAWEEAKNLAVRLEGILLSQMDTNNFDCEDAKNIQFQNEALLQFILYCKEDKAMIDKELQIWKAYQNNIKQNLPVGDNLQKIGDDQFLYNAPFYFKNQYKGLWSIWLSKKEIIRRM